MPYFRHQLIKDAAAQKRDGADCCGWAPALQAILRQTRGPMHSQLTGWQDYAQDLFLAGWRSLSRIYFPLPRS